MDCPNIDILIVPVSKARLPVCKKAGTAFSNSYYTPTVFQLQQFCRRDDFARCPFFIKSCAA